MYLITRSILAVFFCTILTACGADSSHPGLKKVVLGVLPYADHSFAIIAKEKGWFKEAGLDVELKLIEVSHIIPYLQKGNVDVCSTPPGIIIEAWDNAPDLVSFVFSDLFLGYAVMAQPNAGYKTYRELEQEGFTKQDAAKKAISQMRDKVFAYPPENAIKPFISLVFEKGNLDPGTIKPLIMEDALTIAAMRDKQADFQVGGAPSRTTLYREGFITLINANELTGLVEKPSASTPELAAILQNGWATTRKYYEQNPEIIMKLAGVNYRIMAYINQNEATQKDAAAIHMAYLSKIAGEKYTTEEAVQYFYKDFNPFFSFEQQRAWFHDKTDPHYYAYVNGAIINSWKAKEHFRGKAPDVEDVIVADDTYRKLEEYRDKTLAVLAPLQNDEAFKATHQQALNSIADKLRAYDFYGAYQLVKSISPP